MARSSRQGQDSQGQVGSGGGGGGGDENSGSNQTEQNNNDNILNLRQTQNSNPPHQQTPGYPYPSAASFPYPYPNHGVLPVLLDGDGSPVKPPSSNAATGASAAGVRALTTQAVAFYFRAPVKAFFRTRVDYLAYARALQEQQSALRHALIASLHHPSAVPHHPPMPTPSGLANAWLWLKLRLHGSTPGVIASAVKHYGWRVVPEHVLPPLIANVGVGAVLYTSYLQILGRLHPESALASKRVYPPPAPLETFTAGFLAGSIQSVVAAPLDAVQARYDLTTSAAAGMTGSGNPVPAGHAATPAPAASEKPKTMWAFSAAKLREIGPRGIFAGWGLSFLKDSMGSAVFFTMFEYVKAQGYYNFVTWYYGALSEDTIVLLSRRRPTTTTSADASSNKMPTVIKPHYAIEPAFLLMAGIGASVAQQTILHPLSHIQVEHWERLEALDLQAQKYRQSPHDKKLTSPSRWRMMRAYYHAYQTTWAACTAEASAAKLTMRQWLYRGFWWNTIRQVPGTSAGLIIFELVRRKYGLGGDQVRINKDGYDILLN
ncbi:mitochondrial carrier domain-containing protein [Cercophora scortea]|uniref:Mitochondrial carrier domain-containing protein n=1 Tax=Cercophora scortea TaxID=314031 RepID=A0AAE0M5L1_9PEZI|nr:mitochondrial carrier domain-containing protein [Cercophora scortea]